MTDRDDDLRARLEQLGVALDRQAGSVAAASVADRPASLHRSRRRALIGALAAGALFTMAVGAWWIRTDDDSAVVTAVDERTTTTTTSTTTGDPDSPASTTTTPDTAAAGPDLEAPENGREITFDGIGEWHVGQVLDPAQVDPYDGFPGSCGYWGPREPTHDGDEPPRGLVAGADTSTPTIRSIRIDDNTQYRTASGVGIGTSLASLQRIYGADLVIDRADGWDRPTDGLLGSYNDVAALRNGDRAITFILQRDTVISVKVSTADFWGDDEGCA